MKELVNIIKTKKWLQCVLVFICLVPLYLSTKNYHFYHQTIGVVTEIKQLSQGSVRDEHDNPDEELLQEVTVTLQNNAHQGERVTIDNRYSNSQISDQGYRKGDHLFISPQEEQGELVSATVIGVKRDSQLALLAIFFMGSLIVIGGKSGFFSLLSLGINGVILSVLIDLFIGSNSTNLVLFFSLSVPIFVTVSLLLVSGRNRKTTAAIIGTLLGTFLSFLIGWLVISLLNHKGLRYEEMNYVTRPPHDIFLASLLIGCLGAVMDVAMTISASLFELYSQDNSITKQALLLSGKEIGKDIMGTMTNVLLFSYISGSLPLLVIFLRNQMSWQYTFSFILSLEFARALVGSIGIVLTIPLSIYATIAVLNYRRPIK